MKRSLNNLLMIWTSDDDNNTESEPVNGIKSVLSFFWGRKW